MNPLSLLFLMPRALVKMRRSFLWKLAVWLQERTLMRAHCKPGASGQRDIFTATCNSSGSAGGEGGLGHKVAPGRYTFRLAEAPSFCKQEEEFPCLPSFLGVKEFERPGFLAAWALLEQSYLLHVLFSFLEAFSIQPPTPLCETFSV